MLPPALASRREESEFESVLLAVERLVDGRCREGGDGRASAASSKLAELNRNAESNGPSELSHTTKRALGLACCDDRRVGGGLGLKGCIPHGFLGQLKCPPPANPCKLRVSSLSYITTFMKNPDYHAL